MEHNPDMMLFAARALTFMADVLPSSCGAIVRHGAVPALCARLLTIEYIDLAEQSLQALEKLSHEHPSSLLAAGGLTAVLQYLDFFPSGVQRVAVATAANMCAGLSPEHADSVRDAIPLLTNLLQYQDTKVVDNACSALMQVAEAFSSSAELLEQLQQHGLVDQARQLITISANGSMASPLSISTYYGLVKLLATCAKGSAAIAERLLNSGITDTLRLLLANSAMLSSASASTSVLRTADQLYEVVSLAHGLLPSMPDAGSMVLAGLPCKPGSAGEGSGEQTCERQKFLKENPSTMLNFAGALLPLLLQVIGATCMGVQSVKRLDCEQCCRSQFKMPEMCAAGPKV
jgi:E3 ubiquitin-protein ligase TRIP12